MSNDDKQNTTGHMMDSFFADKTADDKAKMMNEMMPEMMTHTMPHCLEMLLPKFDKEQRVDFVLRLIHALAKHGHVGMSDEEKADFDSTIANEMRSGV